MKNKSLLSFLFSKQFAKMLGISIVVTIFFFLLVLLLLRLYTDHGEAFAVPDLKGLTQEELQEEIQKRDLRFEIIDSLYVQGQPGGAVIDQYPQPGFKVKKDRLIFITINAYGREKVVMPNVKGVSFRQARAIIENKGLEIGSFTYVPDIATNNVLDQQINGVPVNAGDTVTKGTRVDLVLGGGLSDATTHVPNLIGLNIEQAKNKLAEYSLNIGGTVTDKISSDENDSIVPFIYKQKPDFNSGEMLKLGELVDVFFTTDSTKLPGYNITLEDEDDEEDLSQYFNN